MDSADLLTVNDDDEVSCIFDSVIDEMEQSKKPASALAASEFENGIYLNFF
jgi:hypothetical protein